MELKEQEDGWHLTFARGSVRLIQIDYRIGLFLSDGPDDATVYIEGSSRLKSLGTAVELAPLEPLSLAPILPLFNSEVIRIAVQKSGRMTAEFSGGRILEVDPDEQYEAWQISCSIGIMLVCSPGGAVSVFREEKTRG